MVWWGCVLLVVLEGPSWIVWAVLVRVIGFRHPRPLDDAAPLGIARVILAAVGLAVLVLCFLPSPVAFSWREFFESIREVTGR